MDTRLAILGEKYSLSLIIGGESKGVFNIWNHVHDKIISEINKIYISKDETKDKMIILQFLIPCYIFKRHLSHLSHPTSSEVTGIC